MNVSCKDILKYGTPKRNILYMNLSFPVQMLAVNEAVTNFHVSLTVLVFIIIVLGDYSKFRLMYSIGKGKVIPLHSRCGPEGG